MTRHCGNETLRAISFASAILLYLHIAAIPIWFGYASLCIFGLPVEMVYAARIWKFTTLVTLASFCLSTQFYLASKSNIKVRDANFFERAE